MYEICPFDKTFVKMITRKIKKKSKTKQKIKTTRRIKNKSRSDENEIQWNS